MAAASFSDQGNTEWARHSCSIVISASLRKSAHFEQSFSDDGGKIWEVNWIATDNRVER